MFFGCLLAFCIISSIFQLQFVSSSIFNVSNSEFSLYEYFITLKSCDTNGFLDRRYFSNKDRGIVHGVSGSTIDKVGEEQDSHMECWNYNLDPNSFKLQLLRYKFQHVVHCLDTLFIRENHSVYISFIGDSLVRNQFMNFISLIPDYDRISSIKKSADGGIAKHQGYHYIRSQLLNDLLVSFRWQPIINEELISIFNLWENKEGHQVPDLIFLGSTVHNMLKELYNLSDRSFLEIVEQDLLPVLLNHLKIHPKKQIIWMLQSPSIDLLGPINSESPNIIIHVKKIIDYNNIIRRVFKGTGIRIWDSLLPAIEEYIRSCALQRFQHFDNTVYEWCGDFIHYGNRILSIGSQLIYNHLCNI